MQKPILIYGPALLTNSAATKYTNTSGEITVVRFIHVHNTSASALTLTVSIGSDAAATRIFDAYPMAASEVLDHWCEYPLTSTTILQAYASVNNQATITISGDLIQLG